MNKTEKIHELVFEGTRHLESKYYRRAEKCFSEARALDPDNSDILNAYAKVLYEVNEKQWTEEAVAYLQQAIQLDPQNVNALNNLADHCFSQCAYQEAVSYLEKAVVFAPEHADIHTNLALAYRMLSRFAEAFKHMEMAVRLKPKDPWIQFHYGLSFLFAGIRHNRQADLHRAQQIFTTILTKLWDREEFPVPGWIRFIAAFQGTNLQSRAIIALLMEHYPEHVPYLGQSKERLECPSTLLH